MCYDKIKKLYDKNCHFHRTALRFCANGFTEACKGYVAQVIPKISPREIALNITEPAQRL
jgi:hypothetical protein